MALKSYVICLFLLCALASLVKSEDLVVGVTQNGILAYTETASLTAIPLNTRTKNVFYTNRTAVIKGISCVDRNNSEATAIITAGGVGSTFVNIRLKSKRSGGLNYRVEIFV